MARRPKAFAYIGRRFEAYAALLFGLATKDNLFPSGSEPTLGLVRFFRQAHEHVDNPCISVCRGIEEQAVLNKADDVGHRAPLLCGCWANDGDRSEILVKKTRWLRHAQIGLELIGRA